MLGSLNIRRIIRVDSPLIQLLSGCFCEAHVEGPSELPYIQWHRQKCFCSGCVFYGRRDLGSGIWKVKESPNLMFPVVTRTCATSADSENRVSTDAVNELYHNICKSVEIGKTPPNAWQWSLIDSCANGEDIKLLFQALQNLRIFRMSKLGIHNNFNCYLCRTVTKACVRAGALDYGKKTLQKHNVYGLTPSSASANCLLQYAKEHNSIELMKDVMKHLKRNGLPLQPGTADIVFSICSAMDRWNLISRYAKQFINAGAKLRRTSFGTWMDFAAKRGDVKSIWRIEELRSRTVQRHNIATALACAKGYLLEKKPEDAASLIHMLIQSLSSGKRGDALTELQRMVTQWPLEVIKNQRDEDRKALANSLRSDIHVMISILLVEGVEVTVNLNDVIREDAFLV